jgi:hypothetical protein
LQLSYPKFNFPSLINFGSRLLNPSVIICRVNPPLRP